MTDSCTYEDWEKYFFFQILSEGDMVKIIEALELIEVQFLTENPGMIFNPQTVMSSNGATMDITARVLLEWDRRKKNLI